jgi:hypothetical protein
MKWEFLKVIGMKRKKMMRGKQMDSFVKQHKNDKFYLDNDEVSLEKFNDFFDSHHVNGWEEINNPDGSTIFVIFRDEVTK